MDKGELLSNLNGLIGKYEQHRQYIDKARAQGSKFSSAVIEKVIADHGTKSAAVAESIHPLIPEVRALVAQLDAEKAAIGESKSGVDEQIQELELRLAIGEMEEADFNTAVADLRKSAGSAFDRIAAIDDDLGELNGVVARWLSVVAAEDAGSAVEAAPPEAAPEPESAAEVEVPVEDSEVDYHAGAVESDDVSSIFAGSNEGAAVRVSEGGEDIAIETSEISEDVGDAVSAEVQFSALGDGAAEVEIDMGAVESAPVEPASVEPEADGSARRALLIYQESTAEEQIYPFTNDQLTIGRGRENDIQIKNDSKVSRYHCKLFRRGNNFYVEDIKSSNGTLVNGELITDRRLFGGEEIVIGETYFRFRIME